MTENRCHVLFLCTGNSACSIIAESTLNHLGQGKFKAYSAGSHAKGAVHPGALEVLRDHHYDTTALRSKSWDEFTRPDAPQLDLTIMLCDHAAQEMCPIMPGHSVSAHWSLPDPAAAGGTPAEQKQAFVDPLQALTQRMATLVEHPSLERHAVQQHLQTMEKE